MKSIVVFVYLFTLSSAFSQVNTLHITNLESQKLRIIKENKRIKVKTVNKGKIVGRLQILDEKTIMLRGFKIELAEIEKIKKHPVIGSVGNALGFLALSTGTFMAGATIDGPEGSNLPTVIGIALTIGAITASTQPINLFDKGYNIKKKWRFHIEMSVDEAFSDAQQQLKPE